MFVGDVGRPDLRVALGWSADDLGGMLYDSLRTKLMALPDASLVYPAHGAGSLCGKALSKETFSTIGEQRRSNYALQPMSRTAFVELVTADQPDAPSYFNYDAVLNSKERPTLDETLAREVQPMTLDHVLALQSVGAQMLDVRDPAEFAAAHLAGSINIGLGGQYATWAGTVLEPREADRDHRGPRARERGRRRGWDASASIRSPAISTDGLHSLESRPDLTTSTERISAQLAAERVATGPRDLAPLTVDVRAPREREQKRIGGSVGMPLNHLGERLSELPTDRPLLVYCAGGYRSSIAASLLLRHGFTQVSEIAGGIAAWEAAQLPLRTGADGLRWTDRRTVA